MVTRWKSAAITEEIVYTVMTQGFLRERRNKLRVEADRILVGAFTTLNLMDTSISEQVDKLSLQQKRKVPRTILFLKENQEGTIRGRTCANESVQRKPYDQFEIPSLTVATESVFLAAVRDALEGRGVTMLDTESKYLHIDMDDLVHIRLTGKLAKLMVATAPELYWPFVT